MNFKLLKLMALILMLGVTYIFANPANFAKKKTFMLEHLDKKVVIINDFKSCISSATKNKELKSCRQTYKASMKRLKVEAKAKRAELKTHK